MFLTLWGKVKSRKKPYHENRSCLKVPSKLVLLQGSLDFLL